MRNREESAATLKSAQRREKNGMRGEEGATESHAQGEGKGMRGRECEGKSKREREGRQGLVTKGRVSIEPRVGRMLS